MQPRGCVAVGRSGCSGSLPASTMSRTRTAPTHTRLVALTLALSLALAAATPAHPRPRARRQLAEDNSLQPEQSGTTSRRLARATQGLPPPPTSARQPAEASPAPQQDTSHLRLSRDTQADLLVYPLSPPQPPAGATSLPAAPVRPLRQTPPTSTKTSEDDIPVFDRNKVSLDFPGNLFGPSVSLLIKTTKIVGDVIQNSAVRYQTFLRLFRPLFRGPFEIKGLDPPTTTTAAPAPADNEVRRRRRA
ncbi:verprolin [Leguminivora glycinivorella]|uniref:verprolin n=1 Tax=Leguminivora glycinivorella TaxID=1035111 RepID=UPI0020108E3F|nr:verprolin [Leguminivora glycinivorella]